MTSPQHIHIAHGAFEQQLAPVVEAFGARKVMLVTGRVSFESSGAAAIVRQQIGNRVAAQFTDFDKNPTISDVENGVAQVRREKPDLILAVGGGSALDVAKQINLCATNPLPPREYITGKAKPVTHGLPLIACPTTAGTGSEATHFAVCYDGMDKYSFAHPSMKPEAVIIDPKLAQSLPAYQAACCAFDALSQLIESYWAIGATDESRSFSEEGLFLILAAIKSGIFGKDQTAQLQMAIAAYLSGKAIDISKTTAPHALSYAISKKYDIPHGHAVALCLIGTLKHHIAINNLPEETEHLISKVFDIEPEKLPERLTRILEDLSLPKSLKNIGARRKQLPYLANFVNPERLSNHPIALSNKDLLEILNYSYSNS